MQQQKSNRTLRILADPGFRELTSARTKLRWSLSVVTLVMFFGFIVLISTAKGALGTMIPGSAIPVGLLLTLAVIGLVVVLTGIYVTRCNSRFDELARAVKQEFGR